MSTYDQLLERLRTQTRHMDVETLHDRLARGEELTVLDVREQDEFANGHIPGTVFIPRGYLDQRAERYIPDKSRPIVVYCGTSPRSLLAAKTLGEYGYENVEILAGGFQAWKQKGYSFEIPRVLTPEQRSRYSRHLIIPEVGEKGQQKLLDSKVLMLGAGGLGSPAALYLAAAGVGTLGIIDDDLVDRSNLQRQVIHSDDRVGVPKVDSAETAIRSINPDVKVNKYSTRLSSENVLDIFKGYDVVLDGGDNFPTRYLINDACVHLGIPNVHGSVYRFEGQVTAFVPHDGPCYRCLYPEPPPAEFAPSCQEAGVLGVLPGIIGLMQANEVIKLLLGIGDPLKGRLLAFDGLRTEFRELKLRRDPKCPACGDDAEFTGFIDYEQFCRVEL